MNLRYVLLCFCLFFLYISSVSIRNIWQVKWDGLVFSQQWPITACILHKEMRNRSSCTIYPNMTSWTVHGLWPTKFGERGPNNCNASWAFNESKIEVLEPRLLKYWTNIFADTVEDSLWKHEWNKHGTCAAESSLLNSERKYFLEGLRLVIEYDIVSILANRGIVPNDEGTYTLEEISKSISHFTETNLIIDCSYNKKTKQHQLWQIKICLNKHLDLIDCDKFLVGGYKVRGNCPQTGIIYPSSVYSGGRNFNYTSDMVRDHLENIKKNSCKSMFCNFMKSMFKMSLISIPLT